MNRRSFIAALGMLPVVGRFLAEPKTTITVVGGTPAEFGSKTLVAGPVIPLDAYDGPVPLDFYDGPEFWAYTDEPGKCAMCGLPAHDTMTALMICRDAWLESQMRLTTGSFNHFGTR